jgi:hypothetical protein
VPRIIDLDTVIPEDIIVRLNGEDYPLPGDIPVPDFLAISRATERLEEDPEVAEELYEHILGLFRVRRPDLESVPMGARQLMTLVFSLYDADPEPDGDPPRAEEAPAGKTTTTTRKPRPKKPTTASRSSSSRR